MSRIVCIPATPGSLLKRPRIDQRRPLRLGRNPRVLDRSHIDCIKQLPCLKCGLDGFPDPAHIRMNSAAFGKHTGAGERPDDKWTVPLCRDCHDEQHDKGEKNFWHEVGVNPLIVAVHLYKLSPDVAKMHSAIHAFIARIEQ
jgi:hypothetical protein